MINLRCAVRYRYLIARIGVAAVAFGCAFPDCSTVANSIDADYDITSSVRVVSLQIPAPKRGGTYRVGEPYVVAGRTYTPQAAPDYRAEGTASWYGDKFHGRLTANGEIYNIYALSAAHPTLPLPSYVRVTNLENRRSIVVRLNDRGPFHDNRLIDVSVRTAKILGFYGQGLAQVRVDYIGPAELSGSDDDTLAATLRHDDQSEIKLSEIATLDPSDTATGPSETGVTESRVSTSTSGLIEIPH